MSMNTPDLDTADDLDTLDRGDTLPGGNDELTAEEKAVADAAKHKEAEPAKADEPAKVEEQENDDDDDDKNQNFPIRLNKAMSQRDAAIARALAAEAKLAEKELAVEKAAPAKADPVAETNAQLEELYVKVEEARADGDVATAAATQRKIDALNRDLIKQESVAASQKMTAQMQADAQHDAMVDILEERYPQLSKASETFDADLVSELNFQVTAYERMGMSAPAALRKAVKLVLREDPFAPADKAAPAKVEDEKVAVPLKKAPDVKQAIDLNKRQPPDSSNTGVNKDYQKINVMSLSEEEFEKLPETKKRQLRGDDV